jgi:hypothetical protein
LGTNHHPRIPWMIDLIEETTTPISTLRKIEKSWVILIIRWIGFIFE